MNLKHMRLADKYAGFFLCLLFTACSLAARLFPRRRLRPPESILVIKFWGFGSIVLAFDAFRQLRKRFPSAHICAFTLEQNRETYNLCSVFDEVVCIDVRSPGSFASTFAKACRRIRSLHPDIAVDLEFTARFSALCAFFSAAPHRAGFLYQGVWRGSLYTDRLVFQERQRLKDSIAGLFRLIGAPVLPEEHSVALAVGEADARAVEALLEREAAADPLVAMNINASELCLLRRWPGEYFMELADGLVAEYGCHVVFIGGSEDADYVNQTIRAAARHDNFHDLSGKTSLFQMVALFRRCALLISNDSGPLHLAVSCGVPTVSFFGPETPLIYGPEGDRHAVFHRRLSCSPCIRLHNYKHFVCRRRQECLRSITPQEVIEEIHRRGVLKGTRRGEQRKTLTGGAA